MSKFYVCYKCNEVGSYAIDEHSGDTTFPRGEWLVHNDFIITGIDTKKEADKLLKEDPYKPGRDR